MPVNRMTTVQLEVLAADPCACTDPWDASARPCDSCAAEAELDRRDYDLSDPAADRSAV